MSSKRLQPTGISPSPSLPVQTGPGRRDFKSHILDHVVGVGSGAASAVATQRTVHVGGEVIREVGDFEAALQTSLSS